MNWCSSTENLCLGVSLWKALSTSRESLLHLTFGREPRRPRCSSTCPRRLVDRARRKGYVPGQALGFQSGNLIFLHLGEGRKISFKFKRLE